MHVLFLFEANRMKTAGLRIYGVGEGNTALRRLTGGGERMRRNSTKYTIKISRVPSFSHRKPVFLPFAPQEKGERCPDTAKRHERFCVHIPHTRGSMGVQKTPQIAFIRLLPNKKERSLRHEPL